MKKFSYGLEFYHKEIFDLDETEKFKREVEIAEKVESYYHVYSDNLEEIRKSILTSYKLRRELSLEDRIAYVKGIIYSRQYMNESDLDELFEEFAKKEKYSVYNKTVFNIRTTSDSEDYDFFYNFIQNSTSNKDNSKKVVQMFQDLIEKSKIEYEKRITEGLDQEEEEEEKNLVKDNAVDLMDEDEDNEENEKNITVDEFFSGFKYVREDLSLIDRFYLLKEYFPVYAEGILNFKGITEDNKDYPMIVNGMFDYNKHITAIYEMTYDYLNDEFLRKTKNLSLLI